MTSERIIACLAVSALSGIPRTLRDGLILVAAVEDERFFTPVPDALDPALTESLLSFRWGAPERFERFLFSISLVCFLFGSLLIVSTRNRMSHLCI